MQRVRPGALSRVDPDIPTGSLSRLMADKGVEAMRGVVLAARARRVALPCFVGRHVKVVGAGQLVLGPGCQLQDYVVIDAVSRRGVRIGRGVTLDRFVVIRCTGALREVGEGVEIGDHSSIGAFSYLGGSGGLRIGENVLGGQRLSFHPENHVFERLDVPIREQGSTRAGIVIEDDCWLGSGAVFLDGVRVGRGSVVAAGSVVTSDVPAFSVVGGVPAKVLRSRTEPES
jgi:acetyltransferase-like isoleucine patch superfamily enzyme